MDQRQAQAQCDFRAAVSRGDVAAVKAMMVDGADPNQIDSTQYKAVIQSPGMVLALRESLGSVKLAILFHTARMSDAPTRGLLREQMVKRELVPENP